MRSRGGLSVRWRKVGASALIAGALSLPAGAQAPASPPVDSAAAGAFAVLEKHCAQCHQAGRLDRPAAAGAIGNILRLDEIARDPFLVRPGNPDGSRLYTLMLRRLMPPEAHREAAGLKPPRPDELAKVREWISRLEDAPGCPGQQSSAAAESAEVAKALKQAGATPTHFRFITLAHLRAACADSTSLQQMARGLKHALGLVSRRKEAFELVPVGPQGTLFRLDLQSIGWTGADWDRIVRRSSGNGAPLQPVDPALGVETASEVPLVRGDWLADALMGEPLQPGGTPDTAGSRTPGSAAATDALSVQEAELVAALARQFSRPVSLRRAAAELGIEPDVLVALGNKVEAEPAAAMARQLALGEMPRPQFEASAARLLAALGLGPPAGGGGSYDEAREAADKTGLEIVLLANKATYNAGDPLQLEVRASRDCHLTLVSVDQRGRGMVLLPNDFEPSGLLRAGKTLKVPADGAAYVLRVRERGRESIVAACNPTGPVIDGINHDFERQRFTDLGDYATFLSQSLEAEESARPAPAASRSSGNGRGRYSRPAPASQMRSQPHQIWRGGITLEVR